MSRRKSRAHTVRRCEATTKSGDRCKLTSNVRNTAKGWLCIHHDSGRADEAKRMRQRGGIHATGNRSRVADPSKVPSQPQTLDDVVTWMSWTAVAVATGKVDSRVAREVTNAIRQFQSGIEKRDLERQVTELRKQVKELKKRRST